MAITIWHRVECDTVFDDPARGISAGLAAPIYDPLWLLARQLQLGELRGEDAGSVVTATVSTSSYAVRAPQPLEAHVETYPHAADLRLRIRGGCLLLDLLSQHQLDAAVPRARAELAFSDDVDDDLVSIAVAPDGDRILAAIDAHALAGKLGLSTMAVQPVSDAWLAWYAPRIGRGATDCWVADVLEHQFTLPADGAIELEAPAYRGPDLDWYAMDLTKAPAAPVTTVQPATVPLAIDVPGMPVPRFWEIEDPRFDVAEVTAGPGEVARTLLAEIAVCYGGDWLVVPCRLPTAAVCHVDALEVRDVFGVRSTIPAATSVRPDSRWNLWAVSTSAPDLRFIADRCETLDGEALEEVTLVRDELANVVWAHERIVPSPLGVGEEPALPGTPPAAPSSPADLIYVPLPALPAGRIPLARTDDPAVLQVATTISATTPPPIRGTILSARFQIRDGELGDDGIVISRRFRAQRRRDGSLITWIARARRAGAAQPATPIDFDAVRISAADEPR